MNSLKFLFLSALLFSFSPLYSQDKVKIALDGTDKVEFTTNNIGDLRYNTLNSESGSENLFFGFNTGQSITHTSGSEGYYNTSVGNFSLVSNNTGRGNSAFGTRALNANTTGNFNTTLGFYAMEKNTIGSNNVAIGPTAGYENLAGSNNIVIGNQALYFNDNGNNNVAIGTFAGINNKGNANVFIGNKAGQLEIGNSSDKLYIDNRGTSIDSALIYGEFDNQYLRMNANAEIFGFNPASPAIKGVKQYPAGLTPSDEPGVYGENVIDIGWGIGVIGKGNYFGVQGVGQNGGVGVFGESTSGVGVGGTGGVQGIRGDATGSTGFQYGVGGNALTGNPSGTNTGVYGQATNASTNYSIYGDNAGSGENDWAGYFNGKVNVVGELVTTNKISTSAEGIEFSNNNSVKKAIKMRYIIAHIAAFPSQGGGNASDATLIGEVRLFAGNFPPKGWLFCEGQVLPIAATENQALFSIIGAKYGGDGVTTFQLPDLRDAVPIHH